MKNLLTATNIASVAVVSAALLLLSPTQATPASATTNGYGAIAVSNTSVVNGFAQAGGDYDTGFKFRMRLTLDRQLVNQLMFKFGNWTNGGTGSIATAGNMKVGLADNSATASAASTTYGSALNVVSDADTNTPGVQNDAFIWVKVPANTPAGSYSTSYGVQTVNSIN